MIDWSRAPDWANWHAIDEDGRGHWYESEPVISRNVNVWDNEYGGAFEPSDECTDCCEEWKQSKVKRLKETKSEDINMISFSVDWSKAPGWAMYHAFSKNGSGYWYEEMPVIKGDDFLVRSSKHMDEKSVSMEAFSNNSWKQSLTRRPQQCTNSSQTAAAKTKHTHYHKPTNSAETVDVYWVLNAWEVDCHATGHAIKKLLNAGQRGAKSKKQDLQEAIDSIARAIELLDE